jgi:hypothetical protein
MILKENSNKLRKLFSNLYANRSTIVSNKWWRVIGILFILLSLGLMGRNLVLNLSQLKTVQIQFNLISLLIGLFLALQYRDAINYHLVSIAAKYLPGLGWQQASKLYQLYQGGVPTSQTWQSATVELILIVVVGLTVAIQLIIAIGWNIPGWLSTPGFRMSVAGLLWVCCAVAPIVVLQLTKKRNSRLKVRKGFLLHLWFAELLDIVGWLTHGLALWFIIGGVTHLSLDLIPNSIITLIISFIGGLAIIFVPNGFGVREAIMFTILQGFLPISLSILVAIIFRIVSIVADLLGVFTALAINIWRRWIVKASRSSEH